MGTICPDLFCSPYSRCDEAEWTGVRRYHLQRASIGTPRQSLKRGCMIPRVAAWPSACVIRRDWDYEISTAPTQTCANSGLLSAHPTFQLSDTSGIDICLLTTPTYIPQPHKLPSPQFRAEEVLGAVHRPAKHGFVEDPSDPAKRTKMGKQSSGGRISCPYFKRFPEVFCSRRTCLGPGFDGMNRLKEHLYRTHFKKFACSRCGMDFGDNKRLDEHMRALEPCFAVDLRPDQGFMSHPQWNEIQTNRKHGVEVEDKWRQIYLVLFPDADPSAIPGPYFDGFATSSDGRINATNKC
ncbi:hypothetical protein MCOR13_005479 [Pyricularia oryzae]|nr:hypothetical protein MCOR13_005479 [Pyricularia oryzae]